MQKLIFFLLMCSLLCECKSLNPKEDTKILEIEDHLKKPFTCIENIDGKFRICYEIIDNGGLEPELAKKLIIIDQGKQSIVFKDKLLLESVSWIDDHQLKILMKYSHPRVNKKESGYIYNVFSNKKLELGYEKQ